MIAILVVVGLLGLLVQDLAVAGIDDHLGDLAVGTGHLDVVDDVAVLVLELGRLGRTRDRGRRRCLGIRGADLGQRLELRELLRVAELGLTRLLGECDRALVVGIGGFGAVVHSVEEARDAIARARRGARE